MSADRPDLRPRFGKLAASAGAATMTMYVEEGFAACMGDLLMVTRTGEIMLVMALFQDPLVFGVDRGVGTSSVERPPWWAFWRRRPPEPPRTTALPLVKGDEILLLGNVGR